MKKVPLRLLTMPVTEKPSGDTEIKKEISLLNQELGSLQRQAIQSNIPIIVLFEGADAAGKGTLMNHLLLSLDPRNFKVHATHSPDKDAVYRPFLWRFWIKTPERNQMTIFDRSWYRHLIDDRVEGKVDEKQVPVIIKDITNFEKQLTDDGVLIIKIYLTISRQKQRSRFKQLEDNPSTAWRVTKKDWKRHKKYEEYSKMCAEMIDNTHTEEAPWHTIDSTNFKLATIEMLLWVSGKLKKAIQSKQEEKKPIRTPDLAWRENEKIPSPLDETDLSLAIDPEEYRERRKLLQGRLFELEHELYLSRRPMVMVFEGWDAAGKGGAIRRLVKGLDPRSYEVITVSAPNDIELSHHYLWRFWNQLPKAGHIGIFDRSWYGRVMVERLEGFCSEEEWKRAYREINEMEDHWAKCGTIILKFWMHINKDEQLARFEAREANPHKRWKITEEDWRNREKWDAYKIAVDDMIELTDKPNAPWVVVEGNDKPFARIKVLETTVKALEKVL